MTVRPTLTVVRSSLNPLMRVRPSSDALAGAVRAALYRAGVAAIADTESGTAQMAMTNAQIDGRRMRDQPDCLMIDFLLLRHERRLLTRPRDDTRFTPTSPSTTARPRPRRRRTRWPRWRQIRSP